MTIDQVNVTVENGHLDESELKYYLYKAQRHAKKKKLKSLQITIGCDFINLRYSFHNFPFDRIRRIDIARARTDKCG